MKKLLIIALMIGSLNAEGKAKKLVKKFLSPFDYATLYSGGSWNTVTNPPKTMRFNHLDWWYEETPGQPNRHHYTLSFGLRKIARLKYEPDRGPMHAGDGGEWYNKDTETYSDNAQSTIRGFEYLIMVNRESDVTIQEQEEGGSHLSEVWWETREGFIRYTGDWFSSRVGFLVNNDINLPLQFDLRLKKQISNFNLSSGFQFRTHKVYGFPDYVIDNFHQQPWWEFAEHKGFSYQPYWRGEADLVLNEEDGLYYIDWDSELWYMDFIWYDKNGNWLTENNDEFLKYHFNNVLAKHLKNRRDDLPYVDELSIVIGFDYYNYDNKFWMHIWGNWLPYHYGFDKFSFGNYKKQDFGGWNPNHENDASQPGGNWAVEPIRWNQDPEWVAYNDYDLGIVAGYKLKDHWGIYCESKLIKYWDQPSFEIKAGLNYQIIPGL